MSIDSNRLTTTINFAVQKALADKNNDDKYFKNMSKHKKCSKCSTELTKEIYKKDRTICRSFFNTITLDMMKKRLNSNLQTSSSKQPSSRKTVSSEVEDLVDEIYEITDTIYDDYGEVHAANKRGMYILKKLLKNKEITKEQFNNISASVSIEDFQMVIGIRFLDIDWFCLLLKE